MTYPTCPPWCSTESHDATHDPVLPLTYLEHQHRTPLEGCPGHYVDIVQLSEHLHPPRDLEADHQPDAHGERDKPRARRFGPGRLSATPPVIFAPAYLTEDLSSTQARALAAALTTAANVLDRATDPAPPLSPEHDRE